LYLHPLKGGADISEELARLSAGPENAEDILADWEKGIRAI